MSTEGWRWVRCGAFLTSREEFGGTPETLLSMSVAKGVIPRDGDAGRAASEDLSGYRKVRPGDLVVNRLVARDGAFDVSRYLGSVSPAYWVLLPDRDVVLPAYLRYAFKSRQLLAEVWRRSKDMPPAQFDLPWPKFKTMPVLLPPLATQRAIADYLDRETARIDTLIEEQQRLVEMLRERREGTVRAVLLCGLERAETKPSGVELLGRVPTHWDMIPARYLCTITTGSEDSGNAVEDGEYPFYVRGREILRINKYAFDGEAVMTPGDGQGGTGKVFHYCYGKFDAHQRVYVFKDFSGVTGWYFYYFLSTFLRPVALAGSNTVTMESLRRPLLANFKIAVPPLEEQKRITAYLDEKTEKIDQLIRETERFIDLARERRSALITAAVTGQIDVREAA